jgi:uncharacterized membrane protein
MATATRKPRPSRGAPPKRNALTTSRIVRAITILRPAEELYTFWRRLENLAKVVKHPIKITALSDTESHWVVTGPAGSRVEWDAVITEDRRNEFLAWESRAGADVSNRGSVRFTPAPGDEGTEVAVELEYQPPGGKLGALIAKLTGKAADQQVGDALRRMKALLETGEMPTIEGQPAGGPQAPRKGKK